MSCARDGGNQNMLTCFHVQLVRCDDTQQIQNIKLLLY